MQLMLKSNTGIAPYRLKHKVFVSEALISEVKQHFGTAALDSFDEITKQNNEQNLEANSGEDVTSLVVEQAGELFGQ